MPSPCEIAVTGTLKLYMRPSLHFLWFPPDAEKSLVYELCLSARPIAHRKRIDFGGFRACSVRSAITRRASAVTATSASCCVSPYAITPGSSRISASQRPSCSCSNSIVKDCSLPSGEWGTVAISASPSGLARRGDYLEITWLSQCKCGGAQGQVIRLVRSKQPKATTGIHTIERRAAWRKAWWFKRDSYDATALAWFSNSIAARSS